MSEYEKLLRDIVRLGRNVQREPLLRAEIATVLERDPTVADEALGGHAELFIEVLRDEGGVSLSGLVTRLLRSQCEAYMASDIEEMRDTIETEDRREAEYARGCTA
jgi:hypothetical protein